MRYFGYIASEAGIDTDLENTRKIAEWPRPQNVRDVRGFLRFEGYYCRFVGFSRIANPLTDLIGGPGRDSKQEE